jgi:hypothetical protein
LDKKPAELGLKRGRASAHRLVRLLSEGGMGSVYEAEQTAQAEGPTDAGF